NGMKRPEKPGFPVRLILIFVLFTVGVTVFSLIYYNNQKKAIQQQRNDEISAIADLKVSRIDAWLKDRIADLDYLRASPFIGPKLQQALDSNARPSAQQEVLSWMNHFKELRRYESVIL